MAPLEPPKQETLVATVLPETGAAGCVMLTVLVAVQLFASVTVHVHVPAVSPVTLAVPSPVGFPGVQL